MGIQLPRVILSTTLPTSGFIYSFSRTTIIRINWLGKEDGNLRRAWATIQILEDSKSHQNFQVTDPYSIFQEEHAYLEKSMESMIKFQNDPLNMIEAKLSRLENMRRNKETLPTRSLTIPNTSSHIDENQES